jgi:hypothetical protein
MEFLMILFFMMVYIGLAVLFVFVIGKLTKRKIFKWLASIFVILLPIWDVVLGIAVYHIGCRYVPKVAIYETAETDGIYYEGMNDEVYKGELRYNNKIEQVAEVSGLFFWQGKEEFKYLESKVTKKRSSSSSHDSVKITPVIYRCISLPKERSDYTPARCFKVEKAENQYVVKVRSIKIGIAEINFKKIIDRSSGKLLAEYNRVNRWGYAGILFIPFFEWLNWRWWSKTEDSTHCPLPDKYEYFEFEVLKPKK